MTIFATAPMTHQKAGFDFGFDKPATLFSCEPGTGKTKIAIDLAVNWGAKASIVIAPKSVLRVWSREVQKHGGGRLVTTILDRGSVAQKVAVADLALKRGIPTVLVANYESVFRSPMAEWVLDRKWDCAVLDESHRAANSGTHTSRFVSQLHDRSERRLCLTGTPLSRSPLSVFGQFRFLDPKIFGSSYKLFENRYSLPHAERARKSIASLNDAIARLNIAPITCPQSWASGLQNREEYEQKLARITYHCRACDVLDLPPLVVDHRSAPLGKVAQRIYHTMERELVADLGDGQALYAMACNRLMRLQQITSGHLPDNDGNVHAIDHAKADILRDVLVDRGDSPVVVFARFKPDLDVIQRTAANLGLRYGELSGRRRDAIDENALMNPNIDVAGVQIQSGGLGIDLTRAKIGVFYSVTLSLAEMDQALHRIHRNGQTHSTLILYLLAEGTVDYRIHRAMEERKEIVAEVLASLLRDRVMPPKHKGEPCYA
jgi:SNF2 family DNA or RNA helicase